jgi:hypothetical protein
MIFLALWVLLALQFPHLESGGTGFDRIRTKIGIESGPTVSTEIAALYVNPPNELAQKSDSSGIRTNLYLFPDQTYLFAERGPFLPATIFDKGTWRLGSGVLELKSDPDVTWNPDLERRFLMLHRTAHSEEVLLVGADKAVNRFETLARGNPEIALLTVAKQRIKIITAEQATRIRDDVMRKAWHPERFGTFK